MKGFTFSCLFLFLSLAANAAEVSSALTMNGTCKQLVIPGADSTKVCVGKVVNVTYNDGRSGFYFVAGDLAVVTFSGMGSSQVKINADEVMQPVDHVIFGLVDMGAKPNSLQAVGSCHFTNPYKGRAFVNCVATTQAGKFSAKFVTDGQPPE